MKDFILKFYLHLDDHDIKFSPEGVIFHRWLPDGQSNAISLETTFPSTSLQVWFNRYGYTNENQIEYDLQKQEVDQTIMKMNGMMYSGPLHGRLKTSISDEEKLMLNRHETNDPKYVEFGEKIIKILQPPLSEFLNLIRINYGQYWIKEIPKWNSKTMTVGNFLSHFRSKFSLDGGTNWQEFEPENVSLNLVSTIGGNYHKYLTESDWEQLSKDVKKHLEEFSLAMMVFIEAYKLLDQKKIKLAFIDGVSALDLALTELYQKRSSNANDSKREINKFLDLSLPVKVSSALIPNNEITTQQIDDTLKAIDIRNKVAHESHTPTYEETRHLRTLLRITAHVLGLPEFRFLRANVGNAIMTDEKWQEYYKKYNTK